MPNLVVCKWRRLSIRVILHWGNCSRGRMHGREWHVLPCIMRNKRDSVPSRLIVHWCGCTADGLHGRAWHKLPFWKRDEWPRMSAGLVLQRRRGGRVSVFVCRGLVLPALELCSGRRAVSCRQCVHGGHGPSDSLRRRGRILLRGGERILCGGRVPREFVLRRGLRGCRAMHGCAGELLSTADSRIGRRAVPFRQLLRRRLVSCTCLQLREWILLRHEQQQCGRCRVSQQFLLPGWQCAAAELQRCWIVVSGGLLNRVTVQGGVLRPRCVLHHGRVRRAVHCRQRPLLSSGKCEHCGRVLPRRFILQRRQRAPDRVHCGGVLLRVW